jgi:putative hemolysin
LDFSVVLSSLFDSLCYVFLAADTQGTTILVCTLIVLLLLVFIMSGAQVALFSLNNKDMNVLKTRQNPAARRIVNLLEEPKEVFASLLIAGTFSNICIIILANFLITEFAPLNELPGWLEVLIKVVVIAFVLVFFGQILPKVWATQNNLRFAYGCSPVVEAVHLVLRRISRWFVSVADGMGKRLGANRSEAISIQELDEAIDIQTDDEASPEEKNIMKGIVKFGNIAVKQIMTNRVDVSGIEYNTRFNDLIQRVEELHYSRLPVYHNNLDNIAGVLNTKDLIPYLKEGPDFDWRTVIRQPYFVPETRLIEDLLIDLQKRHLHFSVVVDEFGGTSGIVTMEDIMEEVIGEIRDEFDEEETQGNKIDDNTYLFDGRTMIHDMCKIMHLPMDTFDKVKGESESVGGLILELAGEFPTPDTVISANDFDFTVVETDKNRIVKVKVAIKQKD